MTKPLIRTVLVFLAVISGLIGVSATVSAQDAEDKSIQVCSMLQERQGKIVSGFESRLKAYQEAKQSQADARTERLNQYDEKLASIQAKADLRRSQSYQLLTAKTADETVKEQLKEYTSKVDQAVSERRQAYDAARAVFRQTVDQLLQSRNAAVDSAAAGFRSQAVNTLNETSQSCDSTRSERKAIRDSFVQNMRAARLAYGDALRGRSDFGKTVKEAAETRNKATQEAKARFEQTMQSLKDEYSELIR